MKIQVQKIPLVLLLTLAVVFASLGRWQLQRLEEKIQLIDNFEQAPETSLEQAIIEGHDFARVQMLGRYEQNWSLLLDNKIFHGRTGVHVLSLFRTSTGKSVLVDRGWLEMNPDRRELPVVPVMNKEVVISGLLSHPPTDGVRLGATQQIELTNGPVLITYLDMETVTAAAGEAIEPLLLKLDAQDATGFEDREWQPAIILPAQHKAYAVQWFALALASIILIFTMAIKIRRNKP